MTKLRNGTQILPNWILHFEEVSNNIYHVELTDDFGRQASTTDDDLVKAVTTCEGYAFDIEKQISKNWGRFLFDYSLLLLNDRLISQQSYSDKVFGSWFIDCESKRLIYDGRDGVLLIEFSKPGNLDSYEAIALKELTFGKYKEFISYLFR